LENGTSVVPGVSTRVASTFSSCSTSGGKSTLVVRWLLDSSGAKLVGRCSSSALLASSGSKRRVKVGSAPMFFGPASGLLSKAEYLESVASIRRISAVRRKLSSVLFVFSSEKENLERDGRK